MTQNCKHPTCAGEVCRRPIEQKRPRKPILRYKATQKPKEASLDQFFADCEAMVAKHPYCSNCNAYIPKHLYRFAVAHILPKSSFPSVAAHPLIWLKLGSTCGCHDASHRLDKFAQMPVFRFAVERFRKIEHLITEKHKLLDTFRQYADAMYPVK
jgi:hypothetical protein